MADNKVTITINPGKHSDTTPAGEAEMLQEYLIKAGFSGHFQVNLGKVVKGAPHAQGAKVVSKISARAVRVRVQSGGNDTARMLAVPAPSGMLADEFFSRLKESEKPTPAIVISPVPLVDGDAVVLNYELGIHSDIDLLAKQALDKDEEVKRIRALKEEIERQIRLLESERGAAVVQCNQEESDLQPLAWKIEECENAFRAAQDALGVAKNKMAVAKKENDRLFEQWKDLDRQVRKLESQAADYEREALRLEDETQELYKKHVAAEKRQELAAVASQLKGMTPEQLRELVSLAGIDLSSLTKGD